MGNIDHSDLLNNLKISVIQNQNRGSETIHIRLAVTFSLKYFFSKNKNQFFCKVNVLLMIKETERVNWACLVQNLVQNLVQLVGRNGC